jgi:hypothetical protein
MWSKFVSYLSLAWSRLWPPLLAASLAVGFTYLLKRRDERRELRKKLSAQLYIPVRQQLSEAEPAIRMHARAQSMNPATWKNACTSGVAEKIGKKIRRQLDDLYNSTFPNYDKAWQKLNEELSKVGVQWDSEYADISRVIPLDNERDAVGINWWEFLTADAPRASLSSLREGDALRIWNRFMTTDRLKSLNISVEQFLVQRWEEMRRNACMRDYRECRERALREIPKAIASLSHEALY